MDIKEAHAGTLESGDILIQIFPAEKAGLAIELDSSVALQFGKQIENVIRTTAEELRLDNALIRAFDKGALDCTIRARVQAAAARATGEDIWNS